MSLRLSSIDELPPAMREQARAQIQCPAVAVVDLESARVKSMSLGRVMATQPQLGKYGSKATYDEEGSRFDSKLELRCANWLKARCASGEVLWFTRQVPFQLEGGVVYRADFLAVLAAGGVEVIDAKGHDTQASKNKRKQVLARYGVVVKLWPER